MPSTATIATRANIPTHLSTKQANAPPRDNGPMLPIPTGSANSTRTPHSCSNTMPASAAERRPTATTVLSATKDRTVCSLSATIPTSVSTWRSTSLHRWPTGWNCRSARSTTVTNRMCLSHRTTWVALLTTKFIAHSHSFPSTCLTENLLPLKVPTSTTTSQVSWHKPDAISPSRTTSGIREHSHWLLSKAYPSRVTTPATSTSGNGNNTTRSCSNQTLMALSCQRVKAASTTTSTTIPIRHWTFGLNTRPTSKTTAWVLWPVTTRKARTSLRWLLP